jgi:hypothetical protein
MKIPQIALLATLLMAASAPHAKLLINDKFDGSALSPEWTVQQGYAVVGDGFVEVFGSTGGTRDGWILTGVGDPSWSDYHFSTRFVAKGGANGEPWFQSYITFRIRKWTSWTTGDMYVLGINTPKWDDLDDGDKNMVVLAHRRESNASYSELARVILNDGDKIINDYDNNVDIRARGRAISVAINGHKVIDVVDNDPDAVLTGGIGLGVIWEGHTLYDYARAETIDEPGSLWVFTAGLLLLAGVSKRRGVRGCRSKNSSA